MAKKASKVVLAGPTWWLPVKPEDQAEDEGVPAEIQNEHQLYVAVKDAMNWCIEESYFAKGPGKVYYGYAKQAGGIFHTFGKEVAEPGARRACVIRVWGMVEPSFATPFRKGDVSDKEIAKVLAKDMKEGDPEENLYLHLVEENGELEICPFTGGEMEDILAIAKKIRKKGGK